MIRLVATIVLAFLLGGEPCLARENAPWRAHASEAAARFALPEEWVLRVIDAESGGRTHLDGRPITSHAGAMGLMQIMPATWAELRAQLGLGSDPYHPRDNIIAGTAYLRVMYDRFGYPGLFAAYNAGPGRYRDHIERGRPLPRETRRYIARIIGEAPGLPSAAGNDRAAARNVDRSARTRPVDPIFLVRTRARAGELGRWNAGKQDVAPTNEATRDAAGSGGRSIFLVRKSDQAHGE